MNAGAVTLLISTYNWKDALRLCLLSAFSQTVLPDEIVIGDDGSDEATRKLIDELRPLSKVPIKHIWHEDKGFRKTTILNKAIAQANGDYIIQVDGDVIMERHFIQDHLEMAQEGCFVCGSRTKLGSVITSRLIEEASLKFYLSEVKLSFILNSLRSKKLRSFFASRYAKKIDHMRGCNLAFWRKDFILINGYNEDLTDWGHEDGELVYRMHFAGVVKKALKMGGVVYHLWHKESSRHNEASHLSELAEVKKYKKNWCENGVDKYLK